MAIVSINPATDQVNAHFEELSPETLEAKLQAACAAFKSYRQTPFAERARLIRNAAQILESDKRKFAALMTSEMGKTLASAIAEVEKCAWGCRYYADQGESHLADEVVQTNASRSLIRYEPLGPILAVMPWNFPFWQVFRFAAPALMAGNVGLLKHAPSVPQCALAIEEILLQAGFPPGVFQTLLVEANRVEEMLADDRVVAATLTGSVAAGSAVARAAGQQIKKTVLELGGSDPFIVMPSADLNDAIATAVKARTINSGQSCIAAKRFIIADSVYDEFERRFVEAMRALVVGDPMDDTTDVGPLAMSRILHQLEVQVQRSLQAGARVLTGGRKIDRPGYYYEPTVLVGLPRDAPVAREEFFGPVAVLFRVADANEAIRVANDTPFGLGASAWTRDPAEQELFARSIEAGAVFLNGMVASDPRLPFGGVKRSGYGRELGVYGIREFVNVKTVWYK